MSWHIELQTSGLFIVATEVGRPMLDGVFRQEVTPKTRMKVLHQIAEAPAMESLLKALRQDIAVLIKGLEDSMGGGAAGQVQARQAAPRLYEMLNEIDEQLSACSEKSV